MPPALFSSIKDKLTVRLEGLAAYLQGLQQRYGYLGVINFLACNNFALAVDASLAIGDEPISMG
jgi:hypothetical protein